MDIVLIDDDDIGVFLTENLLRREGIATSIASFTTALDALAYLQQAPPDQLPQVIFLDLNMPLMNGWDFLEALRPLEAQLIGRSHVYILTSSLSRSDSERIHQYPLVTGLIHKPLDSAQIHSVRADVEAARSG